MRARTVAIMVILLLAILIAGALQLFLLVPDS